MGWPLAWPHRSSAWRAGGGGMVVCHSSLHGYMRVPLPDKQGRPVVGPAPTPGACRLLADDGGASRTAQGRQGANRARSCLPSRGRRIMHILLAIKGLDGYGLPSVGCMTKKQGCICNRRQTTRTKALCCLLSSYRRNKVLSNF